MNTKIMQILASVKVEDVFAKRLATVLKSGNIHTVDVLLGKSKAELLKLNGFGKGMVRDVAEYFEKAGVARSPFYEDHPWSAMRYDLEQAGYTEGAICLFREMLPRTRLAKVRLRKEEINEEENTPTE